MSKSHSASEIAYRLAQDARAVCQHYLSNGRREGRYWLVGDVNNSKGRSLFVRLHGASSGKGAAGKWTDAATGQHGDLLDLIGLNKGLDYLCDTLDEACRFLALPRAAIGPVTYLTAPKAPIGSTESARRLFAMSQSVRGTLAEIYLRHRGITSLSGIGALRFHPRCYYRPEPCDPTQTWPALIAAVTDLSGTLTGVHRTWLDPSGRHKAPVDTPRRAMGHLIGNGVRFGSADDVMLAGEGVETMLALKCALPAMPIVAALSANHLAALVLPRRLQRLYVAREHDPASDAAWRRLTERCDALGIGLVPLLPVGGDFNDDLCLLGLEALQVRLREQLVPADVERFLDVPDRRIGALA